MQVVDHGTSLTTDDLHAARRRAQPVQRPLGAGWSVAGLEQITSATGGVILNEGEGGASLWFAGSFGSGGGTYTDPAGRVLHADREFRLAAAAGPAP